MSAQRFDRVVGELSHVPLGPGIYRVFDALGRLIYVGKAKRLRRRLAQYRNAKRVKAHSKMRSIVKLAARWEWTVFETEAQAAEAELSAIQNERPKLNTSDAFSHRYPFLGWKPGVKGSMFLMTSDPQLFPEFEFFGCYRRRKRVSEFFGQLVFLLRFLEKPASKAHLEQQVYQARSKWVRIRSVPSLGSELDLHWRSFLMGYRNSFLELLTLALLEKEAARTQAATVNEALKVCQEFEREEARSLRSWIKASGYTQWPVTQSDRDRLRIRARFTSLNE